jgi:hypothetical protein
MAFLQVAQRYRSGRSRTFDGDASITSRSERSGRPERSWKRRCKWRGSSLMARSVDEVQVGAIVAATRGAGCRGPVREGEKGQSPGREPGPSQEPQTDGPKHAVSPQPPA